jgi:hypothetical protein
MGCIRALSLVVWMGASARRANIVACVVRAARHPVSSKQSGQQLDCIIRMSQNKLIIRTLCLMRCRDIAEATPTTRC